MDIDEQERIDAINRYMKGDKPANICREMNRSKKWFFKWLKRFKTGDEGWYRSLSRAPKIHGRQPENAVETAVVSVRKALMEGSEHESKYLGVDADAVRYKMHELGFI